MKFRFKIKSKKKQDKQINFSLFSVKHFLFAFAAFGSVITICFLLFFNNGLFMVFDIMDLNEELVRRAWQTFFNVLFISLVITIVYNIFKWFTVKVPLMKLLDATHKIMQGDFSARVKLYHPLGSLDHSLGIFNEFDVFVRDFNKMAEELSSIETLKTDFISNVSHELKTPLSVIQNYSTMLQNPEISAEERIEYAKILSGASENLTGLISNILRLNKLENQQIFPEKIQYNLSEQICECMLYFENEWEGKKLEIETDFDEELTVYSDKELLSLVWSNLISNAVKFCDEGDSLSLKVKREGEMAVVVVSDTGCGMSEEIAGKIFEKFYQGDTSRSTKGNGLGLALVRKVIDITGGEIEVESEEGAGSTFTVRLPVK